MERKLIQDGAIRIYQGATPVGGDAHYDTPLSNFASAAFDITDEAFIADRVFPVVNVSKQSDRYYELMKHDFSRNRDTLRAPKTPANRVTFSVSSNTFFCDNYALAAENAIEDLVNADTAVNLRQNSIRLIQRLLRLDQEVRVASLATTPANVGSSVLLSGATSWFSTTSADIIGQVMSGHAFIRSQTGLLPNTAIVDYDSFQAARRNSRAWDQYKYTTGESFLSIEQLRQMWQVDNILIGRAIVNNSATGWSSTNVWGNNCVLAHISPATGLQSMTAGVRFRWQPGTFPANFGVMTDVRNRAGQEKIEIVEAGLYQDEKIVAKDLMYCINTSSGNTGGA